MRSVRRPWKLGLGIVASWKSRMFYEESLEKIKFRAFPKRVGPRILSGFVNFHCMQIGPVMTIRFIFGDD